MNDTINFTHQVIRELLGKDLTPVVLVTAYIFVGCGLFLRWFFMYKKRGATDRNTPYKFNFGFWLRDNLLPKLASMMATFIVIFLTIRFPMQFAGEGFSYFYAVSIGIGIDYAFDFFKNLQPHVVASKEANLELK